MAVGSKIAEIIKEKGLTQKEVADRAGIKPQTLNNIITRDSARADIQILLKICKALDVKPSVFAADALEEFYQDHPNARLDDPQSVPKLTDNENKILTLFRQLTPTQQGELIGRAELLVEQNEEVYRQEDIG